ncbi:structural maintenance of chromosomes protein 2-like [Copidosoma floridanum]|uniref:structural maintenance of chromosomes protein 2-like n=1 Tax=Copidosoma floridanum TaxID=29053 RepID=UPI0006C98A91|nr:structural maintenance of chromosomes protein 2-like [Copidosoma floridanum]
MENRSAQKISRTNQNATLTKLPPQNMANPSSTKPESETVPVTRDVRMNNAAKLRQQFIEEIKDIVLSLKDSIKNLQIKIAKIKKEDEIIKQKLRDENKLLCKQSKIMYDKEQENKVLRLKVEELYGYQKTIVEHLEDITTTLGVHDNLSEKLTTVYDSVVVIQQNDKTSFEEELNKITPDKDLSTYFISFSGVDEIKKQKEEDQSKLKNLENRIKELQTEQKNFAEDADKKKNVVIQDLEKLKQDINTKAKEVTELEKNISQYNTQLEEGIEEKIKDVNNEIVLLMKEKDQLDQQCHEDKENTANFEKIQEKLKASETELESLKQNEIKVTNILQSKICELEGKLKGYQDTESRLRKLELEIRKEEEILMHITQECERKRKESKTKNKSNDKTNEIKTKIRQVDHEISEAEVTVELMQKEIREMNGRYESKLKEIKSNKDKMTKSISQYNLPNLFVSEEVETEEKLKYRRKLYTPTFADDELEIDSLPIDEQFNHLTQTSNSPSQLKSPEKPKRFFKRTSEIKKGSTPRGRGRGKKY